MYEKMCDTALRLSDEWNLDERSTERLLATLTYYYKEGQENGKEEILGDIQKRYFF
jgi:hypothetical protein